MSMLRQICAVAAMNLKSLPQRAGTSLVIVIGIAGVVAVLISVLAMSTGMIKTMSNSGRDDRVLVMRDGAQSEVGSVISRDAARIIAEATGVKRTTDGKPAVSAEAFRLLNLFRKDDGTEVSVTIRGVGPQLLDVRPELKVIAGRMFEPAVHEVIVGKGAKSQFKGLEIGDVVRTRGASWTVVGEFESAGDSHESELLTDAETLMSSERRNAYASMIVMLDSVDAFQGFKDSLTSHPSLAVRVDREREYFAEASKDVTKFISVIAYVVGGIMAIGAVFAALNTMYSAVSARLREIATLRALGFGSTAMVISVLAEALLLSLIGAVIGASVAWLFFNGHTVSTSAADATGVGRQLVFDLAVSPQLVILGIVWACGIGMIGGLLPGMRAARLPVATALRSV